MSAPPRHRPPSAREAGRVGVLELVLWDVALVGLVAGLAYVEGEQLRAAPPLPAPVPNSPPPELLAPELPAPAAEPPVSRAPAAPAAASGEAEVAALRARASAALRAGRPHEALATWLDAPAALRQTPAWTEAWAAERGALEAQARTWALARCLGLELQAAAEEGARAEVEALLAALPAEERSPFAGEPALADRVRAAAERGGLRLRGFSPDRLALSGERCALECTLPPGAARSLLADVDAVLGRAAQALGGAPLPRLQVRLLGAHAPPAAPEQDEVVSLRRSGEPPASAAARVRLRVARWAAARAPTLRAGPARRALALALAEVQPAGGTGGLALTASGSARRLLLRLGGEPSAERLLASLREPDPALAGLWALLALGLAPSASPELAGAIREVLAGRLELARWLDRARAEALLPSWRALVEGT